MIMGRTRADAPSPAAERLTAKTKRQNDFENFHDCDLFKQFVQWYQSTQPQLVQRKLDAEIECAMMQPMSKRRPIGRRKGDQRPSEAIKKIFMKQKFVQSNSKQTIFRPNVFCRCHLSNYPRYSIAMQMSQ